MAIKTEVLEVGKDWVSVDLTNSTEIFIQPNESVDCRVNLSDAGALPETNELAYITVSHPIGLYRDHLVDQFLFIRSDSENDISIVIAKD